MLYLRSFFVAQAIYLKDKEGCFMAKKHEKQKENCKCLNCQINGLIDSMIDEMPSYEFERLKVGLMNKLNFILNVDAVNRQKVCDC